MIFEKRSKQITWQPMSQVTKRGSQKYPKNDPHGL